MAATYNQYPQQIALGTVYIMRADKNFLQEILIFIKSPIKRLNNATREKNAENTSNACAVS